MKLISSKGKGHRKPTGSQTPANRVNPNNRVNQRPGSPVAPTRRRKKRMTVKKKVIIILSSILCLMLLLAIGAFAVLRWQIQPFFDYFFRPNAGILATLPAVARTPSPAADPQNPGFDIEGNPIIDDPDDPVDPSLVSERNEKHINFLLFGIDEHGNTDVTMMASLNIEENTLDVVSIPRDTMVNVSWNIRKVNSIYAYMRNKHRGESGRERDIKAMQDTKEHFRNLLGFHPDFVITVGFSAFIDIVDAVGPISYNVPVNVNEMGIRVPQGQQRLNGRQALAVMRSRRSYSNHAIGRDYAQQEFLLAVAKAVLSSNWSATKVADMANTFYSHVRTDISDVHLLGFATDFMKLNLDNINFHMMPGAIDSARGNSYITVQVPQWLELINERFNPFSRDITETDLSVLTRGPDRRLMVTDGNWLGDSGWAGNSLGPSNPYLTTATTRPVPGRSPPEHLPEADREGDRNPVTDDPGGDGGDGGNPGGDGGDWGNPGGDGGDGGDGD